MGTEKSTRNFLRMRHCLDVVSRCPMHLHTPSLLFAIKQFKGHEVF